MASQLRSTSSTRLEGGACILRGLCSHPRAQWPGMPPSTSQSPRAAQCPPPPRLQTGGRAKEKGGRGPFLRTDQVEDLGPGLGADGQQVPEALGDEEGQALPLPLQQSVGGHGGAHADPLDARRLQGLLLRESGAAFLRGSSRGKSQVAAQRGTAGVPAPFDHIEQGWPGRGPSQPLQGARERPPGRHPRGAGPVLLPPALCACREEPRRPPRGAPDAALRHSLPPRFAQQPAPWRSGDRSGGARGQHPRRQPQAARSPRRSGPRGGSPPGVRAGGAGSPAGGGGGCPRWARRGSWPGPPRAASAGGRALRGSGRRRR